MKKAGKIGCMGNETTTLNEIARLVDELPQDDPSNPSFVNDIPPIHAIGVALGASHAAVEELIKRIEAADDKTQREKLALALAHVACAAAQFGVAVECLESATQAMRETDEAAGGLRVVVANARSIWTFADLADWFEGKDAKSRDEYPTGWAAVKLSMEGVSVALRQARQRIRDEKGLSDEQIEREVTAIFFGGSVLQSLVQAHHEIEPALNNLRHAALAAPDLKLVVPLNKTHDRGRRL